MDRSRGIVDHLLNEIIGDGDISHLPGAGKPLRLNDDPHMPSDQRAAQKIMQDNNVSPEWVETGKAISQNEKRLAAEVKERAERYYKTLKAIPAGAPETTIRTRWSRYAADFRERVKQHNREALLYNLKAPAGIPHKPILKADRLLNKALDSAKPER